MNMCKRCGLPDGLVMREDGLALPTLKIKLDDKGVCNLCNDYEREPYNPEKAHQIFLNILEQTKGTKPFDAIVGVSGGKDGCYVAYDLIRKYDLKILMFSGQQFQSQEATKKCDEFAEKLQKRYPNNVTYLPFRKEDMPPIAKLMFKKSFLTTGFPCAWCAIQMMLLSINELQYCIQCAPLFVNGAEPKQLFMHKYAGNQNTLMTFGRRHEFENFKDYQQAVLDKLSKEIAVFFNYDQEEMERVLSINSVVKNNDPESSYYKDSIKELNYLIEKNVHDQAKRDYLLKAVQNITFENNQSHYILPYFAFHNYDENMIRETLKNDLNYTAPPTHSDCCMHGVIDYIFVQEHLFPISTTLAEKAVLARMGKISKEEVESFIMNKNDKKAYPSEKDMKNFCEYLDITEEEFNTTIEYFKEQFRKYMP